ncbi:MAG: glycoside hydrolase family 3 C-terminal domain-containing protein [Anaerolineae bacterium]|nr:glycoside hydrolase family 3 C-terminal domain-containing protein [Anaerolineae bacterium]
MTKESSDKENLTPLPIVAGQTAVLEVDGLQFKDLNKNGRLDPYEDWRLSVEERVTDLVAQMTLEEKAGLMVHPALEMGEGGTLLEEVRVFEPSPGMRLVMGPATSDAIVNKEIRHVLTRSHDRPEILAVWNNRLQELAEGSRLGIPVTISSDPRNGFRHDPNATSVRAGFFSQWPEPIGLAATRDEALVRQFGEILAREYKATGIRTALHPMADLATEPRWGRIVGTFGEDAELAAKLTAAYIKGFQGEDGLTPDSVVTMCKHFPGGGPQRDGLDAHNDYGKEQVYPGGNFDYHLIPFKAAIEAKTAQMMPYYGIPVDMTSENVGMGYNRDILIDLLRGKMGFDGVICTDWGITSRMVWGVEALTVEQRYKKAIEAGVDQFGGDHTPEIIVDLVRRGELAESRIDESVSRLLRDKFKIGLFENPYVDPEQAQTIVGCPEFQAVADVTQRKSIVLLKNQASKGGKTLPLSRGTKIYIEGINPAVAAEYGAVVDALEAADVAILRVQTPFETGPGFFGRIHQGNLAFQGKVLQHLQDIMRAKPTVIDIYLDRPAVIPELEAEAAALLGSFGASDRALLDVIFGDFYPTGKLPFELPSSMAAVTRQKEDVPYDSENPLFEFGAGLNYDDD